MLIISASNVIRTKENSQSYTAAKDILSLCSNAGIKSELIDLRNYSITGCTMCEGCISQWECSQNDDFNKIYGLFSQHNEFVIVLPHYAGIPSKVIAIVEKLQEFSYLQYCTQHNDINSFKDKSICIIAHGGLTEDYEKIYTENIIIPMSNILKGIGFNVINDQISTPLCFGVKEYFQEKEPGSACFRKDDDIQKRNEIVRIAAEALISFCKRV